MAILVLDITIFGITRHWVNIAPPRMLHKPSFRFCFGIDYSRYHIGYTYCSVNKYQSLNNVHLNALHQDTARLLPSPLGMHANIIIFDFSLFDGIFRLPLLD